MISIYDETYEASLRDPERFWARAAEAIHWRKRWDRVFDAVHALVHGRRAQHVRERPSRQGSSRGRRTTRSA